MASDIEARQAAERIMAYRAHREKDTTPDGGFADIDAARAAAKRIMAYRAHRARAARLGEIRSIVDRKPGADAQLVEQVAKLPRDRFLARFAVKFLHRLRLLHRLRRRAGVKPVHRQNVHDDKVFERGNALRDRRIHKSSPAGPVAPMVSDSSGGSTLHHGGDA